MNDPAPLMLRDVPAADGNVTRLYAVIGMLIPRGRVATMNVHHDDGCPCTTDAKPLPFCTCELVDVEFRLEPRFEERG